MPVRISLALLFLAAQLLFTAWAAAAAGKPIAPSPIGPSADSAWFRDVAYAGGRFLTVWNSSGVAGTERTYGAFNDREGRRVSPASFVVLHSQVVHLDLVAVDDSFVLFWVDRDYAVRMTRLDADGRASHSRTLDHPAVANLTVAWNGSHFAVSGRPARPQSAAHDVFLFESNGDRAAGPINLGVPSAAQLLPARDSFIALVMAHRALHIVRVSVDSVARHTIPYVTAAAGVEMGDGSLRLFFVASSTQSGTRWLFTVPVLPSGQPGEAAALHPGVARFIEAGAVGNRVRLFVHPNEHSLSDVLSILVGADGGMIETQSMNLPIPVSRAAMNDDDVALLIGNDERFARGRPLSSIAVKAGVPSDPEVIFFTRAHQGPPHLLSVNGLYLAAWPEFNTEGLMRRTLLDANGDRRSVVIDQRDAPSAAASNGAAAMLIAPRGNSLVATIVDSQLRPAAEVVIERALRAPLMGVAASWTGSHYVVIWVTSPSAAGDGEIYTAVVTTSGAASDPQRLEVITPRLNSRPVIHSSPQLAFDGERLLFVWIQSNVPQWPFIGTPPTTALTVRLDASGSLLDPAATVANAESPQQISLATSGSEFVLLSSESSRGRCFVRATTLTSTGPSIGIERSRVIQETAFEARATAVWTGGDYAVVISQTILTNVLVTKYVGADLGETRPARTVATSSRRHIQPTAVATPGGQLLIGYAEPSADGYLGAVTFISSAMDPLPPLPSAPLRAQMTAVSATATSVHWESPLHGAPVDAYAIEVHAADGIFRHVVDAEARSTRVPYLPAGATVYVRSLNAAGLSEPVAARMLIRRRVAAF